MLTQTIQEREIIIIGSGIGGLSCAALLANMALRLRFVKS